MGAAAAAAAIFLDSYVVVISGAFNAAGVVLVGLMGLLMVVMVVMLLAA